MTGIILGLLGLAIAGVALVRVVTAPRITLDYLPVFGVQALGAFVLLAIGILFGWLGRKKS